MTEAVKKIYKEAKSNKEFDNEMKSLDPEGYKKPSIFSSDIDKILYASSYYGWLIGKGKYNRQNYF
ncbi:hypothetical protein [Tenacibaculum sp. 190524A05c]|uniref:hypothetical protein n=1 Tax=Tenacibaculum platacis TaxID=3137852 RepID=UPI0031FAFF44